MSYRPYDLSPHDPPGLQTAGLILIEGGKVLLEARPADARVYAGCLDLPGGHVESAETPELALLREAREELAIEVLNIRLVAVQDDVDQTSTTRYRHFIYHVIEHSGSVTPVEGQTLVWLDTDDVARGGNLPCAGRLLPVNPLASTALRQGRREGWL